MIKQTNKNLSDSDRGEIRKIKVVRRAGDDDSQGGCHSLEARVGLGYKGRPCSSPSKEKSHRKEQRKVGGWLAWNSCVS